MKDYKESRDKVVESLKTENSALIEDSINKFEAMIISKEDKDGEMEFLEKAHKYLETTKVKSSKFLLLKMMFD